MNIFVHELKSYTKPLMFWFLGIGLLLLAGFSKYEGYAEAGDELIDSLLASLPDSITGILGGPEADLTNILTYFSVLFLYISLPLAIHASLLGAGILAKEERDKTTEFLYVKPRSRASIITAKLSAALVLVTVLNLIVSAITVFMTEYFKRGESIAEDVVRMMIGAFFIQLIFLTVGMASAAIIKNAKRAAQVATGAMVAMFQLSVIIDIAEDLADLKYLTPFKFFDPKVISEEKVLDPIMVLISAVVIISSLGVAYYYYRRRDLAV